MSEAILTQDQLNKLISEFESKVKASSDLIIESINSYKKECESLRAELTAKETRIANLEKEVQHLSYKSRERNIVMFQKKKFKC